MSKTNTQRTIALNVVKTLQKKGFVGLFAGGCVRDTLLGREPNDYDIATDAYPEEVETLFPKTIPIGKAFGVIAVVEGTEKVEVATFREEVGTLDGRHPETVMFSAAKEDALRRDFTINGIFYDPVKDELHDYVNGQRDLERKVITAIGNPEERFAEDHLRMLRAIRFAHNLEFRLEPQTEQAISNMAGRISNISSERIEAELSRMLTDSPKPGDALRHLYQVGLLKYILPEVLLMIGQEQPPQFHPEGDVFEHTCLMLNLMNTEQMKKSTGRANKPAYTPRELAYSILLHDIGKPLTASLGSSANGESRIRFDGHAKVSADLAEEILTRLKFSNKEKKHIIDSIRGHMRFMDVQNMKTSTLRKMIGAETFELEMALHRLDCLGSHAKLDNHDFIRGFQEKMDGEPILPKPWISGHDLIAMEIKEGRLMGKILKEAYDAQIEDRFASSEELKAWVKKTYAS